MKLEKIVTYQITMSEKELDTISYAAGLGYKTMNDAQCRIVDEFRDIANDVQTN